ncbi:MAG: hypothetical protein NTX42_06630 [Methanothrix sp.]|nr:hypothetical protein [Methanothrix sp.]
MISFAKAGDLVGTQVDAIRTPNLVPTIAVLGALAEGKTTVFNTEHVRHKETDRLHAMAVELSKMGADIRERPMSMAKSAESSWRERWRAFWLVGRRSIRRSRWM